MKTSTNYKLKLPEDSDPVQVSDLSDNFSQLDTLIKSVSAQIPSTTVKVVSGSYYGNGQATREIPVGFTVKVVFCNSDVSSSSSGGLIFATYATPASAAMTSIAGSALSVDGTSIVAHYNTTNNYRSTNRSGYPYNYVAIGI